MIKRYWLILILFLPCLSVAQTPSPVPTPRPVSTPPPLQQNSQGQSSSGAGTTDFTLFRRLEEQRILSEEQRVLEKKREIACKTIQELYRKPSSKELLSLKIEANLLDKYKIFLAQKETGIIKLLNNNGCGTESKVLSASVDCLKNKMPGNGFSYSFRYNNYRIRDLADLSLEKNFFNLTGNWIHGFMVEIGDVPIEDITFQTPGLNFLINFQPATDYDSANLINIKTQSPIKEDKFIYYKILPAKENSTYILRSIAYRGEFLKSIEGIIYNELDFDKRQDIIVAFRVVNKDSNGNLIILWKKLLTKDVAKIKAPKQEK